MKTTREDLEEALERVSVYYPTFKIGEMEVTARAWLLQLKEFDKKLILEAIDTWASENSRYPHVSQIKQLCIKKLGSKFKQKPQHNREKLGDHNYYQFTKQGTITDLYAKKDGKNLRYIGRIDPNYHMRIRANDGKDYTVSKIDFCMKVFGPKKITEWLKQDLSILKTQDLSKLPDRPGFKQEYLDWLTATTKAAMEKQKEQGFKIKFADPKSQEDLF